MYFKKISIALYVMAMCIVHHSTFASGNVTINGMHYAGLSLNVSGEKILGSGTLQANNITISCDEFLFTGIIRCYSECKIYVKKDFDHSMFKKEGPGNFTIIINPYEKEECGQLTLLNKVNKLIFKDPLLVTEERIGQSFAKIRRNACENGLNEDLLVQAIQKKIDLLSLGVPVSLKDIEISTGSLLVGCGVGLTGLAAASMIALKCDAKESGVCSQENVITFALMLGGASLLGVLLTSYELLVPEELFIMPHEKLLLIQEQLNKVFAQPYVSEVKIIKL